LVGKMSTVMEKLRAKTQYQLAICDLGFSGLVNPKIVNRLLLYRAVGCGQCNDTGYLGRLVITEVLIMSDRIRQSLSHATATEIRRQALAEGMSTMYEDGLRKALTGRTTVEEVMRVAGEET